MSKTYQCPDCGTILEVQEACGSESYFCPSCKMLVSRSRIKGHPNYAEKNDANSDKK